MLPTAPDLRRHAHDLAKAFHVNLVEAVQMARTPEAAIAIPMGRTVVVAPITDESTYAIALHEMGHLVSPWGALHGTGNLTREAEDATWARSSYDAVESPPATKPAPPAPAAPIGQQINWRKWR